MDKASFTEERKANFQTKIGPLFQRDIISF